ncbi:Hypothetical protein c1317 [Escherichia coli CFT073]|uniref:Uncharacterized protein n=1 Tax=Escherichia coli O6:H1 (strain CFT073 / ATCC 700928 / UPEC) TaxID=199310 RepID=A0A0H2V6A1_ECOL6|nr:Hypothetical protein c1317 [Escherichia coli CFT073]
MKKPLTLHAKNFLQTTPASTPKTRMCNSSMPKNTFCRTATSCGKLSFLPTKGKKVNVYPCLAVKLRKVSLTATMMRLRSARSGKMRIHYMNGTRGNFSLSHRWIPRKDALQLMSGMNVNHSYGP